MHGNAWRSPRRGPRDERGAGSPAAGSFRRRTFIAGLAATFLVRPGVAAAEPTSSGYGRGYTGGY